MDTHLNDGKSRNGVELLTCQATRKNFENGLYQILGLRKKLLNELNIKSSLIPVDILLTINEHFIKTQIGISMKHLLATLEHSPTGVRYYLNDLIDDGWIDIADSQKDKRTKLMQPSRKSVIFFTSQMHLEGSE